MSQKPTLYFFAEECSGTSYYQAELYKRHSRSFEIYSNIDFLNNEIKSEAINFKELFLCDVIIFIRPQKEATLLLLKLLRSLGKVIICVMDDLLAEIDPKNPVHFFKSFAQFNLQSIREAHLVLVTTSFLKEKLRSVNENIKLNPNYIDSSDFVLPNIEQKNQRGENERVRVLFSGSSATLENIENFLPLLKNIHDKHSNLEYVFFGGDQKIYPMLKGIFKERVEFIQSISFDKYPSKLKSLKIDFALLLLKDNIFNRAKSNCKYLEMSALGMPVVVRGFNDSASPYNAVIHDGENGFICFNDFDFQEKVESLTVSKELRENIAKKACLNVICNFGIKNNLGSWESTVLELFKSVGKNNLYIDLKTAQTLGENFAFFEDEKNKAFKIIQGNELEIKKKNTIIKKINNSLLNRIVYKKTKYYLEFKRLFKKTTRLIKEDGLKAFSNELKEYYIFITRNIRQDKKKYKKVKDFVFIAGAYFLEAPTRYRCEFQKEQLEKQGLCGDLIRFDEVNEETEKFYDIFILHRVPLTDEINALIKKAKANNKLVIFDIDDYLFEEKLLLRKHEVKEMTSAERNRYFAEINRIQETMKLCDYGAASTKMIQQGMKKFIKQKIIINRNSASDFLIFNSNDALKNKDKKRSDEVILGYFSGSKSHNEDFALIEDVLIDLLKKFPNLKLLLVGYLKLSSQFEPYLKQIVKKDVVDWKKLPDLIAECDINLAPLVTNTFNQAKSELKFTEAALLKVPTIASNTEPFVDVINDGVNGYVAKNKNEWREKLKKLIENISLRIKIGEKAYLTAINIYNTTALGKNLFLFINKIRRKKIVYVCPMADLSGGTIVICKHLDELQKRGFNVAYVTGDNNEKINWFQDFNVPVIPFKFFQNNNLALLDAAVATLWSTVENVINTKAKMKFYFVQGKEYLFYPKNHKNYPIAFNTYREQLIFFTVSKWCQQWLKAEHNQDAIIVPNGIDQKIFYPDKPVVPKEKKIRILIEGNTIDNYKNVDEAFKIIELLPKDDYEVWYISYGGGPKKWYRYDKFFEKVPYFEMRKYYSSCDILLKTSKLESFSYPPLEMMACGGVSVVARNEGNMEYLVDGYNSLLYEVGNINEAVDKIKLVAKDANLRDKLIENGFKTVRSRNWNNSMKKLKDFFITSR